MASSNRNIEELLNYYVDRELSSAEEEELFAQLADNDGLRMELKQMQMIHAETRNYLSAMTPPAALTAGVFAKLGFSGSAAAAATEIARESTTAAASSTIQTTSSLFTLQSLWLPISAAIVSATITTIALFSILTSSNKPLNIISDPAQPPTPQTELVQPPSPVVPADTSSSGGTSNEARSGMALPALRTTPSVTPALKEDGITNTESAPAKVTQQANAAPAQKPAPQFDRTVNAEPAKATADRPGSAPGELQRTDRTKPTTAQATRQGIAQQTQTMRDVEQSASVTAKPSPDFPASESATSNLERMDERPLTALSEPRNTKTAVPSTGIVSSGNELIITTLPPFRAPIAVLQGVPVRDAVVEMPGEHLYLPFDEPSESSPWSLSLRYMNAVNWKGYSTWKHESSNSSNFDNLAVAAYYDASDNDLVFVELGCEAFAQNYNGNLWVVDDAIRGQNTKVFLENRNIYQNTLVWWGTANYMRQWDGMLGQEFMQPYASIGAGWSQYGWFLNKVNAGVRLNTSNSFSIRMGIENTLLLYSHDKTVFTTRKLGLTAGVNIHF